MNTKGRLCIKALIDGDILRYEVGFASEAGWKATTDRDEVPPFEFVKELLDQRIANIMAVTESDDYTLYITEGHTFRFDIAKTKPYKGTRVGNKPWHFDNLTAYMKGMHNTYVVTDVEADDMMGVMQTDDTIICSRDKDLRQVPGRFFSWELGNQPSFGPLTITDPGTLDLSGNNKKLNGTGFAFFCAQMLTGDVVDNIPGVPKCGPVKAFKLLSPILEGDHTDTVMNTLMTEVELCYEEAFGDEWEDKLLEMGQLLWIIRNVNEDGFVFWEKGMMK